MKTRQPVPMANSFTLVIISLMHNKGYTLLEMIISIAILAVLSLLSMHYMEMQKMEHYEFLNDFFMNQASAMENEEERSLEDYDVTFNEKGNVHHADTLYINEHKIIIELGNGRIVYE